jgi:F0F1-type ATP synthase epsilon subunit
MLETGSNIIPGVTLKSAIKHHKIYLMPEGHEWKIALIKGILEVREEKWEVLFDDENECLNDEDLQLILDHACTSN